jgi:soluble lytic murein transglycosylase
MRLALAWWRDGGPRELIHRVYPPAFSAAVVRESARHGIDSSLVWALMREESWFDESAVSSAGATGLMQLMPSTARLVAEGRGLQWPVELDDAGWNIRLGVAHLADLFQEHPFLEAALAAYNAGRSPARRWLSLARVRDRDTFVESITYGETRAYVQRVAASHAFYRSRIANASAQ